jgi:hypothetical protein
MITVAIVDDHEIVIDEVEKNISESGVACLTGKAFNRLLRKIEKLLLIFIYIELLL